MLQCQANSRKKRSLDHGIHNHLPGAPSIHSEHYGVPQRQGRARDTVFRRTFRSAGLAEPVGSADRVTPYLGAIDDGLPQLVIGRLRVFPGRPAVEIQACFDRYPDPEEWNIHEKWLPGVHYDLGRQRFKFLRDSGGAQWEKFLASLGWVSKVIEPNYVLAELRFKWMLESIRDHDPERLIINNVDEEIQHTLNRITSQNRDEGEGDVYNSVAE